MNCRQYRRENNLFCVKKRISIDNKYLIIYNSIHKRIDDALRRRYNVNPQFKKGVMELCVLAQLTKRDQYGYELTETVSKEMDVATATLYVVLKRLKDEGYVNTYLVESQTGPARKYYSLTETGHVYYEKLYGEWKEFVSAVERILQGTRICGTQTRDGR